MSKLHTYLPPKVNLVVPGDGTKVLVSEWPDGEQIAIVLKDDVAEQLAHQILGPRIMTATELPKGLEGLKL